MLVICLNCSRQMIRVNAQFQPFLKPYLKGFTTITNWDCGWCHAKLKFYQPENKKRPKENHTMDIDFHNI